MTVFSDVLTLDARNDRSPTWGCTKMSLIYSAFDASWKDKGKPRGAPLRLSCDDQRRQDNHDDLLQVLRWKINRRAFKRPACNMPALVYPPFPEDVPIHPLLIIDYELLKNCDPQEVEKLWEAGRKLGFWYLKNHGADELVDEMFTLGEEVMALPRDEKMKFEQGDDGMSFGYKAAGANAVNAAGELDTVEFLNIAKDDAISWPTQTRRAYPNIVNIRMESTIVPFIKKSWEVNNTLLEIFNDKLGLPDGSLFRYHRDDEFSGSEARIIKSPPTLNTNKQAIGSHTDFGTLSFLHNRLGGLQVFVPGSEDWHYVKPLARHAICNIGDTLSIFSGGILRSNLHRVVPPPGAQSGLERWSLVFFTRPGDSSPLSSLTEESTMIAEAVRGAPAGKFDTGSTALDWFSRRIKNQRINNREGPETWMASRGTEQVEV